MKLFIVPTPIGNLKDITFRALEVLQSINYIVCEDTRRTKILLDHYEIKNKKLIPYFAPKEEQKIPIILKILEKEDVALVVNAGMPGISDPGYKLIKACLDKTQTNMVYGKLVQTNDKKTQTNINFNELIRTGINEEKFLYKKLSYQLVDLIYKVKRDLKLGHKENIYADALEIELKKNKLQFLRRPKIEVRYDNELAGIYQPDFIIENKIIIEIKSLPYLTKQVKKQVWNYLRGSKYKLLLLVNFGRKDIQMAKLACFPQNSFVPQELIIDTNKEVCMNLFSNSQELTPNVYKGYSSSHIEIEVLPGASAFLTALIGSGLPTDKFLFLGFLPKKGLENYFKKYKDLETTIIFYESAYRVLKTLSVIKKIFGDVQIVIAREISKTYEEYLRRNIDDLIKFLQTKKIKGEITVIFR